MKFYSLIILLIITIFFPNMAKARIDIVPQKVVIDSRERSGEFTTLNLFNERGDFRVELLNYRQNEEGIYEELSGPLNSAFDPAQIVRFSPRQFSVESGDRQKVRLSLRKPPNLPEGEYRFHIKATRFSGDEDLKSDKSLVAVKMNMGIVIPVIVRHGNVSSTVKMIDAQLMAAEKNKNNRPELHLTVTRQGNASALGKITVIWQPQSGNEKTIGMVSNANVFTEIDHRNFKVPLSEIPLGKGTVVVRYTEDVKGEAILDEIRIER